MRRLTLALIAVLLLAGCDLMIAQTSPRPSRAVATREPAPIAESEPPDEVPTLRPDPSGSGPDLLVATDALADLRSYRVTLRSRGLVPATPPGGTVTMTSTLIQTDDPAAEFTMTGVDGFTGGRLDAVVIGAEAWLREGGRSWKKSPGGAADFDAAFTTLSPIELVGAFEGLSGALTAVGSEKRNGIQATHLHGDASDPVAAAAGLSSGTIDVWLAPGKGYLVSLVIDGDWDTDGVASPVYLRIEVSRVNAGSNRVSPPG